MSVAQSDETTTEPLRLNLSHFTFGSRYAAPRELHDSPEANGYPFHAACWRLFLACRPAGALDLDIPLLFSVCLSFPIQSGQMNWGHDYGALVNIWSYDYGGVQDEIIPPSPGQEPQLAMFPFQLLENGPDPLNIPQLVRLFVPPAVLVPSTATQAVMPLRRTGGGEQPDIFTNLPTEILCMILVCLPSMDAARLRLASRTFANVTLPDLFWHSRFSPEREFHHVFEARQYSSRAGGWRQLFESVKSIQMSPGMVERKRIWHLGLSLHSVLQMLSDVKCEGAPIRSFFEPSSPPSELRHATWVTASRALRAPQDQYSVGSRSLFERELKLPPPGKTRAIFISTIDLFGRCYISGIRILDLDGKSFSLGYRHQKRETLISQTEVVQHHWVGFSFAQDQRGIRGLALVFQGERMSQWVGEHLNIPRRLLLTRNMGLDPVEALHGGFDVSCNLSYRVAGGDGLTAHITGCQTCIPCCELASGPIAGPSTSPRL
jgi:hypothetical protein